MKNIIFIAPPAAGKGTQSKMISTEYNIPHISTGDLLRDEVTSGSTLGRFIKSEMDNGNLISDDIMVNLLRARINQVDCNNGYILDGYPRNVEQARIYETLLHDLGKDIGVVIFMDISKELSMKRGLSRLICSACGTSYNKDITELRPRIDGICDKCGHALKVRSDDNEETFNNRYDTYIRETKPLIDYYNNKGILKIVTILETDSAQDVFAKIKQILD